MIKSFLVLVLCTFFVCEKLSAQEVLSLNENEESATAKLSDIKWLIGYWQGNGLGGFCEELWMPEKDGSMQGVFRFTEKDTLQFSEYMHIVEENGSLVVKLKHFNRDLSPWEEKEEWTSFKLVKIEGQTAYFHGLTYSRKGDKLMIYLRLKSADKTSIEEFSLNRTSLD